MAVPSRHAVPFLAKALSDDARRTGPDAERARRLLDLLAARGHEEALRLQHRIEKSSGLAKSLPVGTVLLAHFLVKRISE